MELVLKNPPANGGDVRDVVRSLGREDPLEEGTATRSSTLAWRIPWTEEPAGLQTMGLQGSDMTERVLFLSCLSFYSLKTKKREICAEVMILQILILLNPFSPTLFKSSSPVLCSGDSR